MADVRVNRRATGLRIGRGFVILTRRRDGLWSWKWQPAADATREANRG